MKPATNNNNVMTPNNMNRGIFIVDEVSKPPVTSLLWLKGAAEACGIKKRKVARKTEKEANKKR